MAIIYANGDVAARQHPAVIRRRVNRGYGVMDEPFTGNSLGAASIVQHNRVMRYVLILSLMVLAAGCKSQQVAQGPAQGHVYPGRSTVFGSPRSADAPWFASRNDVRPTVAAGVQSPIVQESASRTYDRTHSYGGQVHDYYYRTRIDVRYRSTTQ